MVANSAKTWLDPWCLPGTDPPYESPLEAEFAYHAGKYIRWGHADLEPQVEVATFAGTFRIDFVLRRPGRTVGVECDGKAFHDRHRDEWRDAVLLGEGKLDAIYRFPGGYLFHHIDDCLYVLCRMERKSFSPLGQVNLESLASWPLQETDIDPEEEDLRLLLKEVTDEEAYVDGQRREWLRLIRRHRGPHVRTRPRWKTYYQFARRTQGSLDAIMAAWEARTGAPQWDPVSPAPGRPHGVFANDGLPTIHPSPPGNGPVPDAGLRGNVISLIPETFSLPLSAPPTRGVGDNQRGEGAVGASDRPQADADVSCRLRSADAPAMDDFVVAQGRKRFHRPDCMQLESSVRRLRRADAIAAKMRPCRTCRP